MKIQPELEKFPGQRGINKCTAEMDRCTQAASWHVLWRTEGTTARCMLLCDVHMNGAAQDFVWLDRHPVSAGCDMPGAIWHSHGCRP